MKDHSHPEPKKCAHDLGWCEKCERPYCKTCGQEWMAQPPQKNSLLEAYQQAEKDQIARKPIGGDRWPWYEEARPRFTVPQMPSYPPRTVLCQSHGTQKG